MSYVSRTLAPGEQIIARAKLHWKIYWLTYLLLALAIAAAGRGYFDEDYRLSLFYLAIASLCLGLIVALPPLMRQMTTEIVCTNRRVIKKTGFLRVHTKEILLQNMQSFDVDQSFFASLFGWGTIHAYSGEGVERLYDIAAPHAFVAAISAKDARS
jgi:hypothetical protein